MLPDLGIQFIQIELTLHGTCLSGLSSLWTSVCQPTPFGVGIRGLILVF